MADERRQRRRTGRKKRGRSMKIVAILVPIVALCVVIGVLLLRPSNQTSPEPTASTEPIPDTVIHLVAGGDLNITDKTVASGANAGGYDYTEVFRDVLPVLASADVTVLNFEGLAGGTGFGTTTKTAPQQMLHALSAAGVDILQTANSCSIFGGLHGLKNTISSIQSAGMTPLGTYTDNAAFEQSGGYLIWEIQGIKIAFVAFTKGLDGMGLPVGSENCVNLLYQDYNSTYQKVDQNKITKVIRNAKAHDPDLIVAMVHWGSEFNDKVSTTQNKICKILKNEGVDAIIGTHSHYVQKIEHDSKDGTLVAWSLGDFLGDADKSGTNYSILLDLEITKDGQTGQTKVTGFDCVPIFIWEDETGGLQVLRIREAMEGYESSYIGSVSEEVYQAMKSALERIAERTGIENIA